MPIYSKNYRALGCHIALLALIASQSNAQDSGTQASTPQPSAPPPEVRTETEAAASSVYGDAQKEAANPVALDYLFNKKAQDGSAAKVASDLGGRLDDKLKALDSLNAPGFEDPASRARFEKFLNAQEADPTETTAYHQEYLALLDALRRNQPIEAWKALFKLNEYPWDAGVSGELANRIESIWDADRTKGDLNASNEKLRKAIQSANWNADLMYATAQAREQNQGKAQPKSVPKQTTQISSSADPASIQMPTVSGGLQMTEHYLKSLESKVRIKQNELRLDKIAVQVKSDFADTVSTLFTNKRYRHVVMAAGFYRQVFGDGDYPVSMGAQVTKSVEIVRDLDESVNVFRYQVENKEIVAAAQTLQGAFMVGELDPAVRSIPRESKRRISRYAAQLQRVRNLIEARDFGPLETLLSEIQEEIADFDPSKPRALVNAVKLESQMRLGKAKLAAQRGDQVQALEEFRAAAEAWPANPELSTAATGFFEAEDVKNQGTVEFDRLIDEQNYRAVFEKQLPFLGVVRGDPERETLLKQALEKVKESEVALEKASLLQRNNDSFGAWESLEIAAKKWPEDNKLNRMRADLSMRSAEFVSQLNKAQEAEAKRETGLSLNFYINAQRLYPPSQLANEGIERTSQVVLGNSHRLE